MKTYNTVMYALDLSQSEFWLGDVNDQGAITGFTNFIPNRPLPSVMSDDIFYYVQVQDHNGELDVHFVQSYLAFAKKQPLAHHSIAAMVSGGILDPVENANKILSLHQKSKLN